MKNEDSSSFHQENWESTHFHNEKSFTGHGLIFFSCLSLKKEEEFN